MPINLTISGETARDVIRDLLTFADFYVTPQSRGVVSMDEPMPAPVDAAEAPRENSDSYSATVLKDAPESTALANETPSARKRGEAAPGRTRRTKAEIAEDEAADKADAAASAGSATQAISTGEERVGPDDSVADQEQDADDEAAETQPGKAYTVDDLRAVMSEYVAKFSLEKATARGGEILTAALGAPPAGAEYWKASLVPADRIGDVITEWRKAIATDK